MTTVQAYTESSVIQTLRNNQPIQDEECKSTEEYISI
jgi:hypothetical protein